MYRTRVTSVNGSKAQADGRWLNIIGNKNVVVGDFVWTDGRCIYGNIQAGGEVAPIISSEPYVPLLLWDGTRAVCHKGQIKQFAKGQRHNLMASQGSSFAFTDDKVLDLYLDGDGNQYALNGGEYWFHDWGSDGPYETLKGQPGLIKNGNMEQPIDLSKYSSYSYDYARGESEIIKTPLSGKAEAIDEIYWNCCVLANGWYESENSYCYLLDCYAQGCHIDAINWRPEHGEADEGYFVDFTSYMWVLVTSEIVKPLWAETIRDVDNDDYNERSHRSVFADEFVLPLPDGYYIEGAKSLLEQDYWFDKLPGKLYSPKGVLICESDFRVDKPIRLGYVKRGVWLLSEGEELFRIKGGKKELLSDGVHNSRLHIMKNRVKWTKGDE